MALAGILWAALEGFFLSGTAGWWFAPWATQGLSRACGVDVRFRSISMGLTAASVEVEDLRVATGTVGWLEVPRLFVDVSLRSLLRGELRLKKIEVEDPKVHLRLQDNRWADLPACLRTPKGGPKPSSPPSIAVSTGYVRGLHLSVEHSKLGSFAIEGGRSELRSISSGTFVSFDFAALRLASEDTRFSLTGSAKAELFVEGPVTDPSRLLVSSASMVTSAGDLRASGSVTRDRYDLFVEGQSALKPFAALVPVSPFSGQLRFSSLISGPKDRPEASVELEVKHGVFGNRSTGEVTSISALVTQGGAKLTEVVVDLGAGGKASASGRVRFDASLNSEFRARTDNLSFAHFMESIGTHDVWADFRAHGPSSVRGTLNPVNLTGPFDFRLGGVQVTNGSWRTENKKILESVPTRVEGKWTFTQRELIVEEANIASLRSKGRASALIRHQGKKYLDVETHFSRMSFADLGPIAGLPLEGVGEIDATLGGLFNSIKARGTLNLEAMAVGTSPLGNAEAEVEWGGGKRLSFRGIRGQLGEVRWRGQVDVLFDQSVPVKTDISVLSGRAGDVFLALPSLPSALHGVDGNLEGRFQFRGPVRQWTGPLSFSIEKPVIFGQTFLAANAHGRMRRGRFELDDFELSKVNKDGTIGRARGQMQLDVAETDIELEVDASSIRLSSFDFGKSAPEIDAAISAQAALSGPVLRPKGEIKVEFSEILVAGEDLGIARLEAQLKKGQAKILSTWPSLSLSLASDIRLAPTLPFQGTLVLQSSGLPGVVGRWANSSVRGGISMALDLTGRATQPASMDGKVELSELKLETPLGSLQLDQPLKTSINRGQLAVFGLSLRGDKARGQLDGELGFHRVQLDLSAETKLDVLSQLSGISRAGGRIEVNGHLEYSGGRDLDLVGRAEAKDGMIEFAAARDPITGINGPILFSQSSILLDGLSGRWASGEVGLSGSIGLDQFRLGAFDLVGKLQRVRPVLGTASLEIRGQMDGGVAVRGTWPRLKAEGGVNVGRATVAPRVDPSRLVGGGDWVAPIFLARRFSPSVST